MGEPFVYFLGRLLEIEPLDHELEYRVTFHEGEEAFADGHYVVCECETESLRGGVSDAEPPASARLNARGRF